MTDRCATGHAIWCERELARNTTEHAALCQQWHEHRKRCKKCAAWREETGTLWRKKAEAAPIIPWDLEAAK
jgi:hypothetical protein